MSKSPGRPAGGNSRNTRDLLLQVARQVLMDSGPQNATIRQIARRADVNPALLHYYFGTKAGLEAAVVAQAREEMRERAFAAAEQPGSVRDRIEAVLRVYLTVLERHPYLARLLIVRCLGGEVGEIETAFSKQWGLLQSLVSEGIEKGELRALDPALVIGQFASGCVSMVLVEPLVRAVTAGTAQTEGLAESWARVLPGMVLDGLVERPEAAS